MDGTATLRMNEFILGAVEHEKFTMHNWHKKQPTPSEPKELTFDIDSKTTEYIQQSEKNFDKLIGDHELEVTLHTIII